MTMSSPSFVLGKRGVRNPEASERGIMCQSEDEKLFGPYESNVIVDLISDRSEQDAVDDCAQSPD